MSKYEPGKIEKRWQKYWEKNKLFQAKESADKPKYYVLDMFPYPSGSGLHVGHPKGYIATDVVARMKMMQGFNVLHPMGWDAFGLPAENYAIKNKVHPSVSTKKNVETFKNQLRLLGFTYDWNREVNTTDPNYYRLTQWIFLEMFKRGLAYESYAPVNWCPSCKTVLANEDLEDGKCERCGSLVEQKPLRQWVLRITNYAERLLNDLDKLTAWPEPIKEMQRNWIGKSEGALVKFNVVSTQAKNQALEVLEVFTTRVDTLFGATYCVIAPEHNIISSNKLTITNKDEVEKYVEASKHKTIMERTGLAKEKTGVELKGIKAINPANGEELPIFTADYVFGGYGTGAIMAVPAHDERDFEFAKKYGLKIKQVVRPNISSESSTQSAVLNKTDELFSGNGIAINSDFLNGLETKDAKQKMIVWLKEKEIGERKVNYRLQDWVFSRQRYWGEPIPLIKCENCAGKKYNYIIIHGYSSDSKVGFKPWLKEELEKQGHKVYSPNLPNTKKPNVEEQVKFILDNVDFKIDESTVLIGHSLGGAVIYRLLEKIKNKIAKAVLVDPVLVPEFNIGDLPLVKESNNWVFDWKKIKNNCKEFVIVGDNKHPVIKKEHLEELRNILDANLLLVNSSRPHFSNHKEDIIFSEPEILRASEFTGWVPVPENELPLELPKVKSYEPSGTGESPLATIEKWVNTKCPRCGGVARRETNTMPQWAGSCWYYLAYSLPRDKKGKYIWDKEKINYWNPIDFYVGGAEHATRHLIYARFWHKFLYDIGAVGNDEPFTRLKNVGLILAEDGRKMSKRWGNVINPDEVVKEFGADAMRVYEMFMGPFDQPCAWSKQGLVGARRFLDKVWSLQSKVVISAQAQNQSNQSLSLVDKKITTLLHQTVKKVTEDIAEMKFNTAISQLMILANEMSQLEKIKVGELGIFIKLLSPFAPHMCEEMWLALGNKQSILEETWPQYDENLIQDEEITIAIQINGKLRDTIVVAANSSEDEIKDLALASEKVQKWLEGKAPKKVIYIKGKLVSIVM